MPRYEISETGGASERITAKSLSAALSKAKRWAAGGSYDVESPNEPVTVRVRADELDRNGNFTGVGDSDSVTFYPGRRRTSRRRNAKQPSKRVRKALKKYVKGQNAGWTPAQVRMTKSGGVQIKVNPKTAKNFRMPKITASRYSVTGRVLRKLRIPTKTRNPKTHTYQVKVPPSSSDPRGYSLKIRAESAAGARAEARKYCAKNSKGPSRFKLPKRTKVTKV